MSLIHDPIFWVWLLIAGVLFIMTDGGWQVEPNSRRAWLYTFGFLAWILLGVIYFKT